MTTPSKPTKTPAQIEKEALQKAWDAVVVESLELITAEIPKLDPKDVDTRANIYRQLLSLRDKVAQAGPAARKAYNTAVDALFDDMDAIPGSMYLDEEEPRP